MNNKRVVTKAWVKAPVKATHNQMIAEAIERMKIVGLQPSYIKTFESEWIIPAFYSPEGNGADVGDDVLRFFMKASYGEAWAVIIDPSDTEGGIIKRYILFVSNNPDNWEKEREELAAMNPTVCLIKEDFKKAISMNPARPSEYLTDELVRMNIRVTNTGAIVLDLGTPINTGTMKMTAKEFGTNMSDEKAREIEYLTSLRFKNTPEEERFRNLLLSTGRPGAERLLEILKSNGFFWVPASSIHSDNEIHGLVRHSLKVYDEAMILREDYIKKHPKDAKHVSVEGVTISALLHDVCKCREYTVDINNKPHREYDRFPIGGHGSKSLIYILGWGFHLLPEEQLAIRWHMGSKRIKDKELKIICEQAKKATPLCNIIIHADYNVTHRIIRSEKIVTPALLPDPQSSHGTHRAGGFVNHASPTGLKVICPDGSIIQKKYAGDTLVSAIKRVGPRRVRDLGIICCNVPLVSTTRDSKYGASQVEVEPGLFVIKHSNNMMKKGYLEKISSAFNLDWKVEII